MARALRFANTAARAAGDTPMNGCKTLMWTGLILTAAMLMWCAGCHTYQPVNVATLKPTTPAPTVTTSSPAPAIASTSVTIGHGLSGLQDVFNTLGAYLDTAYAALPTSKELAAARVLVAAQSGNLTALQNENDSLKNQVANVTAIVAERDQWKARATEDDKLLIQSAAATQAAQTEAAAQKKRADDAAESAMLNRAGWWATGIAFGLVLVGIGLFQDIKLMTLFGIGAAAVSGLMVLIYLAAAWVAAHILAVILVGGGAVIGLGVLAWIAHEKGWLTSTTTDGAVKLLSEAVDGTKGTTIEEAVAALRSLPFIAASWPTPATTKIPAAAVTPTVPG
jgi:hypothetical protein